MLLRDLQDVDLGVGNLAFEFAFRHHGISTPAKGIPGGFSLEHWARWPEDYLAVYRKARAGGYRVGQEGESPRGPFVYFGDEGHPGTVIEMA